MKCRQPIQSAGNQLGLSNSSARGLLRRKRRLLFAGTSKRVGPLEVRTHCSLYPIANKRVGKMSKPLPRLYTRATLSRRRTSNSGIPVETINGTRPSPNCVSSESVVQWFFRSLPSINLCPWSDVYTSKTLSYWNRFRSFLKKPSTLHSIALLYICNNSSLVG